MILGALALPLLVPALAACDRQASPSTQPSSAPETPASRPNAATGTIDTSHKGSAIPSFALSGPDGAKVSDQTLKGKPVVINLWATWCGPCVAEMPTLDALAAQKGSALRVLAVSQDSAGSADKIRAFRASHAMAHVTTLLDPENTLSFHYDTGVLPTTIVYDAQGREVARVVGAFDWTSPQALALLKAAGA